MNVMSLRKDNTSLFINNVKRVMMKFLSIMVLGNARSAGFYTTQYEQLFDAPVAKEKKQVIRVKVPVNDITEPVKNESQQEKPKRPKINYFAGPHYVFDSRNKQ